MRKTFVALVIVWAAAIGLLGWSRDRALRSQVTEFTLETPYEMRVPEGAVLTAESDTPDRGGFRIAGTLLPPPATAASVAARNDRPTDPAN